MAILQELDGAGPVRLASLRDAVGLTAGNLSLQLTVLEQAALVRVIVGLSGGCSVMSVELTEQGTAEYARELDALRTVVTRPISD